MYILETTSPTGKKWVSGVSLDLVKVTKIKRNLSATEVRSDIIKVEGLTFPVYIVEMSGFFQYKNKPSIVKLLESLIPAHDENVEHALIFEVPEEFLSKNCVEDEMGGLMHWHITDETLSKNPLESKNLNSDD